MINDIRKLEGGRGIAAICTDAQTREILDHITTLGISRSYCFREGLKLYVKHQLKDDVQKIIDRRFNNND